MIERRASNDTGPLAQAADQQEVAALLREVLAGQAEILRRLDAQQSSRTGPRRADRAALAAILGAIAGSTVTSIQANFSADDVLDHARFKPELARALEAAGINRQAKGAARRIGKLLARCEGVAAGDFLLQRVGPTREGILWAAVRVIGFVDSP